ncbi:hypothetical protein FB451DRAFT_1014775 [Mycena latifolia]|nr:hypothetical protein FB451DRAFT_1014775 [Mycena latifolia]
MPEQVDEGLLFATHYLSEEAQEAATGFRQIILSQMAFLNWFSTIKPTWRDDLDQEDRDFLKLLRMEERPKKGYVFNLRRDYHEMNLAHLYSHNVPFHYTWTPEAATDRRFLRLSPEFQAEYVDLIGRTNEGLALDLSKLPSFPKWKEDLERYDVFFQDARVGRVGDNLTSFEPTWEYMIVDFLHYGARPVNSQVVRRAYAERFRGKVHHGLDAVSVTFHRQNPIAKDEPPFARRQPGHRFELSDFASEEVGTASESATFYESTYLIREQVKNRCAPRESEGRTFNNYNGMLNSEPPKSLIERMQGADFLRIRAPMSPSRRSGRSEDLGISASLEHSLTGRRRSSRSLSPRVHQEAARRRGRRPSLGKAYPEWYWNIDWVNQSILVCDDSRSLVQMKTWAICDEDATDFIEILNRAVRSGVSFALYIKIEDVNNMGPTTPITALQRHTLSSLYAPGHREPALAYETGGEALYARYLSRLDTLLPRLHAVAFIAAGGVVSFVAQLYAENLAERFREGPSAQLTGLQSGQKRFIGEGESGRWYTTDQVSEDEVQMLLGHIATGNPATEQWLWPPPVLLEERSVHVQGGAWSPGFYSFLSNLEKSNIRKKVYKFRTTKEWIKYIENGNKGAFAPSSVPSEEDFDEGWALIRKTFPLDWTKMPIKDIKLPEPYDPTD